MNPTHSTHHRIRLPAAQKSSETPSRHMLPPQSGRRMAEMLSIASFPIAPRPKHFQQSHVVEATYCKAWGPGDHVKCTTPLCWGVGRRTCRGFVQEFGLWSHKAPATMFPASSFPQFRPLPGPPPILSCCRLGSCARNPFPTLCSFLPECKMQPKSK